VTDAATTEVPERGLTAQVVRDQAAFDALSDEWADLYDDCRAATPFQTHAWLASYARAYCPPGRLRVVVVRAGRGLVAAAPLQQTRRGPWPLLVPLGGTITDYADVLVADSFPRAGDALIRALLDLRGWRLLDLPEVRPDAAAQRWVAGWPGAVTRSVSATSLELPGRPLPELLARLPARTASTLRRKLRKVDAAGVEITTAAPDEVPTAVATLLRLHAEQWRGRGITPEHLTERFAAHLTEAATRMAGEGQAQLVCYRVEGEVLACQVNLVGHQFLGYYLAGVSPRLRERIDVASMQVRSDIERTLAAGIPRYSMLRGHEDYKLRWRPEVVANERLLLARNDRIGAGGYPLVVRAEKAAITFAKERMPWMRGVHATLSALVGRRGQRRTVRRES
jgi:CelD/BcsL family acetyltransferase involved in cellulose biosynthesis